MFPWQRRKYPYTNFHELNADWILDTVTEAAETAETAAAEVQTWDDRITAANTTAEQARLAANTASTVANQALQTAEGISDTANLALERSENALSVAGGADTAAGNAVTTANAASSAANSAAQVAATANRNANTALQQAGQAADSASAAQSAASSSATAAQTAQAQAAAAAQAAQTIVSTLTLTRPNQFSSGNQVSVSGSDFQSIVTALESSNRLVKIKEMFESASQGVYERIVYTNPTVQAVDQNSVVLSWTYSTLPANTGTEITSVLVINWQEGTTMTGTLYERQNSGGGSYTLLASGSVVKSDSGTTLTIPTVYNGTPLTALVCCTPVPDTASQITAWLWASNDVIQQETPQFSEIGATSQGSTPITTYCSRIAVSQNDIQVAARGPSVPLLPNTYRWYIWGTL